MTRQCLHALRWTCGFFEGRAPQSMARAVALLFAIAGALLALAAFRVATRAHLDTACAEVIRALTPLGSIFVVGGAGALLTRTRAKVATVPDPATTSPGGAT